MPGELQAGIRLEDIPTEYVNAVRGEVIADELDGQPPTELKLLMSPD
jgi:hypothetical protein